MKVGFIYLIIVTTSFSIGATGGIVAKRVLSAPQTQYIGDLAELEMDIDALMDKYNDNPSQTFKPAEIVSIALERYKRCEYSYSVTKGTAKTVVQQSIRNYQIKNGDHYFEESISKSSMVSLADRMTQTGIGGDVNLFRGKAIDSESGSYPESPRILTSSEYKELLGRTLDQMFIYIISNATVLKEGTEATKTDEGGYLVTLKLNPSTATYYYKTQMKNISGLDSLPVFTHVTLTYTIDKDYYPVSLQVDESYKASMGITVDITNALETIYHPNAELKIPALNEPLDYSF